MHWAGWVAVGLVGFIVAIGVWAFFAVGRSLEREEDDPYDDSWNDSWWATDNPVPPPPDIPGRGPQVYDAHPQKRD